MALCPGETRWQLEDLFFSTLWRPDQQSHGKTAPFDPVLSMRKSDAVAACIRASVPRYCLGISKTFKWQYYSTGMLNTEDFFNF
jgi:hypothetical protein